MMPYLSPQLAQALRERDLARAKRGRLRRGGRAGEAGAHGLGVIDALGHGLIAIGSRMVSDPGEHADHSRAA